jgi:hypothetical protein
MRRPRSFSMIAQCLVLLSSLGVCAGCWEKIEYTGPRTTATAPRTPDEPPKPSETQVAEASPPDPSSIPPAPTAENTAPSAAAATPVVTAELPETPPSSPEPSAVAEAPAQPKSDDDRYGPAKSDSGAALPPPAELPPASSSETTPPESSPAEAAATNPTPESPPNSVARHTDATPVSATADTPPGNVFDSHRAAWHLGSRLSLAALASDRRLAANNVPIWFEDAKAAAKLLGTSITDLPEPAAADDKSLISSQAFDYLVTKAKPIGRDIAKQHGPEDAALFEIAIKSNLLLLMYTPEAPAGNSIAAAILQAAPKAKLPDELWKPLVEALNKQAPQSDVRTAVRTMHVNVDRYLADRAEHKAP